MKDINTIIFDLGGVMIDWNPRYLYRKIFNTEAEIDHLLNNICTSDWNEQQDAGRSLEEATNILVNQYPEYEAAIRAFYGRWEEMLNGPIQGTVDIFHQLKATGNYRMLALTNWSAETWPIAWERYDFLHEFEGILVSGKEMLKKPDHRIYQLLIDRYDFNPVSSVFIDDNYRNVTAAKEIGIHAFQFFSPEQLAKDLKSNNIL